MYDMVACLFSLGGRPCWSKPSSNDWKHHQEIKDVQNPLQFV